MTLPESHDLTRGTWLHRSHMTTPESHDYTWRHMLSSPLSFLPNPSTWIWLAFYWPGGSWWAVWPTGRGMQSLPHPLPYQLCGSTHNCVCVCVCACVYVWERERKKLGGWGRIAGGLGLTREAVQWRVVCRDPSPPEESHTCCRQSIRGGTCESYQPSGEKDNITWENVITWHRDNHCRQPLHQMVSEWVLH